MSLCGNDAMSAMCSERASSLSFRCERGADLAGQAFDLCTRHRRQGVKAADGNGAGSQAALAMGETCHYGPQTRRELTHAADVCLPASGTDAVAW